MVNERLEMIKDWPQTSNKELFFYNLQLSNSYSLTMNTFAYSIYSFKFGDILKKVSVNQYQRKNDEQIKIDFCDYFIEMTGSILGVFANTWSYMAYSS